MAEKGTLSYIHPTVGGKTPTQEQMQAKNEAVHATVSFSEGAAGEVHLIHNMMLPDDTRPMVHATLISGGPAAPMPQIGYVNENTISVTKVAPGAGTNAVYDIIVTRPIYEAVQEPKTRKSGGGN